MAGKVLGKCLKHRGMQCKHGRQKSRCKECGGVSICVHARRRDRCRACKGTQMCAHGQRKSECARCGGARICQHGHWQSRCVKCGGSEICEHKRRRSECMLCAGSRICRHGKRKDICKRCERKRMRRCMKNGAKKKGTQCTPESARVLTTLGPHTSEMMSSHKNKCTTDTDLKEHAVLLQEPVSEEELFMEKWLPENGKCKKHPLCEVHDGHLGVCEIPQTCACAIAYHKQVQARIAKLRIASKIEKFN